MSLRKANSALCIKLCCFPKLPLQLQLTSKAEDMIVKFIRLLHPGISSQF